jgi:hypothetical protein
VKLSEQIWVKSSVHASSPLVFFIFIFITWCLGSFERRFKLFGILEFPGRTSTVLINKKLKR